MMRGDLVSFAATLVNCAQYVFTALDSS
jgi:hypothetical protein